MLHPLNPAQERAVEHQTGPLLVLAGAGSGKTRVITHRIARLIERGVPARAIVALTFTNKAAAEMRSRVDALLRVPGAKARSSSDARAPLSRSMGKRTPRGADAASKKKGRGGAGGVGSETLTVTTFHSFGLGVLTRERSFLGGQFTIFDQGDCLGAVKEILRTLDGGKRLDAQAILARISNAKNAFLSAEDVADTDDEYDAMTRLVYPRYQAALRAFRALDFDDLVCEVPRLWKQHPEMLVRWQERYRFILVDEYQDTNRAQLEVLRLLAATHKNICAVGDDDQAIYGWRGAEVKNILEFEDHFPGAEVVKLEQNYRSYAPILAVANAVIAKRADTKHRKVLFTERKGGDPVRVVTTPNPDVEASWVAKEIQRMTREEGKRASQIAVLYRSNGQSAALEEALREQGIAHRVIGGQQFFERKEVKDVLAYLKVVVNPFDEISLRRIINYPARGIGETSVERLALHAAARGWPLWQAVERVDALDDVAGAACEGCKSLEASIQATREALRADPTKPSAAVRGLCAQVELRKDIDKSSPSPSAAARRWGNVEALFASFERKEARSTASQGEWLASFLQALTLQSAEEEEKAGELVTLCTLHGSKGLEFDCVFLVGCEEGLLPHARTLDARVTDASPADIEEERRLFYVGVTRARDALVLARCKTRALRGKPVARTPSRFLADIPPELVLEVDVKDDPARTVATLEQGANALLAALDALGR
jgi:superfamily I DNA/RNA helicase